MDLTGKQIIQRAAISRALKAKGYTPERIAAVFEAMDRPDGDDEAPEADDEVRPDSWTRQLEPTRACAQTKL
jgi:anthranilate phosphoribosyltransferase